MILTVDELREHVSTDLGDDALQRLLDAAEEAIIARAGAPGERTEFFDGGHRYITPARPVDTITSISETWWSTPTVLATDDYQVIDGLVIERLSTGTNSRYSWPRRVTVVYTPVDDDATRIAVQIELVELELNTEPGAAEERIGDWTQRFANTAEWNTGDQRETILARLNVSLGMVVIG